MDPVEVDAAGTQIGAGETHIAEPGAVGTAPDGYLQGRNPHRFHGGPGPMDQVHMGLDLLPHIVIGILQLQLHRAGAVFGVEVVGNAGQAGLAVLKLGPVVVPDDIGEGGGCLVAGHLAQVVEALVALGVGRGLGGRQQIDQLHGHENGALHLVFGRAGVDVHAMNGDLSAGGVEVFILQLAQLAAVYGVGHRRAEARHVEVVGAAAHLLVGGKAHGNAAMGDLRVEGEILHGGHDLRHAGLVVSPQQGSAVGDDQVLAHIFGQALKLGGLHGDLLFLVQEDVAPLIVDNAGLYIGAGGARGGVHVGDKAHAGDALTARSGGQPGVDVAVFVHVGVVQTHLTQFRGQGLPQYLLLFGGGSGLAVFVRLSVVGNILQKAFHSVHVPRPFSRFPSLALDGYRAME